MSKRLLVFGTIIVVLVALVTSVVTPVRRDSIYVCEITGSIKHHTTWLKLVSNDYHESSPFEEFMQSKSLFAIPHKWVWVSASENNLFGGTLRIDDSLRGTYLLAEFVRGGMFAHMSDEDKLRMFAVLVWSSNRLSDDEKSRMYSELLNSADEDEIRAVMRSCPCPPLKEFPLSMPPK